MNPRMVCALTALVILPSTTFAQLSTEDTYTTLVDASGKIGIPEGFRSEWTFLGTWSVAEPVGEQSGETGGQGAAELHNVYTQPGVIEAYRETGEFPDGTVLVKELLSGATKPMTTGVVSRGTDVEGWFILVKDTRRRFTDNPLWGDGWGWVLYSSEDRTTPVTKSYQAECLGCHIPARETDWIYVEGYPVLEGD